MILQPQHNHEQTPPKEHPATPPKNIKEPPVSPTAPPSVPVDIKPARVPKPPQILSQMLTNSLTLLPQDKSTIIKQKMKYLEEKVHYSFADGPGEYLAHISAKTEQNSQKNLKEMIEIENWLASNRIWNGKTKLEDRAEIYSLKGEISSKLHDMKRSMIKVNTLDKQAASFLQNILEFRKKNYYMHQTEKKAKVKSFLSKMKRIQSEQKKRYQKELVKQEYRMQLSLQKEKKQQQQAIKKVHSKQIQKHLAWKMERNKWAEEERKKKEQIQSMLEKLQTDKPVYKRMEQDYIKNVLEPLQEQRQKRLEQIRKRHAPIEPEEFDQHIQRYNDYKQTLMEEHRRKDQQNQQMNSKLQEDLKSLYHSKFHKEMQPNPAEVVKEGHEQLRKKIKEYQKSLQQKHKPKVDPTKRQRLKQSILQLQLKQDKSKIKVKKDDGTYVLQSKPQYNGYRLGVQYLQKLREQNQGKPRKRQDRSASLIQLPPSSKVKRIDYLRQNKPNLILKKTIGEWKKIVGDDSYSPRQKYQSIMQQAEVLERKAKMKQQQMGSYKKGDKAMQLKSEMDRYYAESVAAKMVVLKDVILKK